MIRIFIIGFLALLFIGCGEDESARPAYPQGPKRNPATLAREAAMKAAMAGKGALGGVRLMSEETWEAAHSGATQKFDDVLLSESR